MRKTIVADTILFFIALIWGATFVVVQNAIQFLPANTFNAIRFLIASVFLLLIMLLFYRKALHQFAKPLVFSGILLGFWLFGGYAFQTIGLDYTTPAKAGFITGLAVVLVPLLSFLLLKERVKWTAILGVFMAVCGLWLLTATSLSFHLGDILVFGCSICFALQIVLTGKYAKHFPALPLAIVQLFTVTILSTVYALLFEDWRKALQPEMILAPDVVWGLLITGIPATALAFLAQTAFQKQTSSTHIALIFALEPVFAALTSYLWIDERLTAGQMAGCSLILFGMFFAELPISAWMKTLSGQQAGEEKQG